jgi:GMP synthase-like glutamine amidotransferase
MKPIFLLKTGELPRRVIESLGPYERAFLNVLGDERFVVVDARKEPPPEPDWAGVIITGSPASTYDGDTWIAQSEDFLRQAADRSVPLYRNGVRYSGDCLRAGPPIIFATLKGDE